MLRIGHNPNTNMLPLFYYLPREHPLLTWVTAEPAGHNALLAQGQIDLAPISAFSYGEHWQEYAILPNLSVSTRGRVGSILLFSKVPLVDLAGKTIALTSHSATSVNLVKIILHDFYGIIPDYVTMTTGLKEMFNHADAGLLIGDEAIQAAAEKPECYIFDLGEEWFKQTGCSMTYALWAFPRRLIEDKASEIRETHELLLRAKELALENMGEIVEECVTMLGGNSIFWLDYFSRFKYDLDDELITGLKLYFDLCYKNNLLPCRPELNFWPK